MGTGWFMRMGIVACAVLGAAAPGCLAWPTPVRFDASGMVRVEAEGFDVRVSPDLFGEPAVCARVLSTLRADLGHLDATIPADVFDLLRERTVFWVESQGAKVEGGMSGRGMVFHPSAFWLRANGLDPARAGGIEIVRAADFLAWRDTQPLMVLHELAHAYHHLIGVDEPGVLTAFTGASEAGLYDAVRRAGRPGDDRVSAYAMTNSREYFAELSEAYFGRNDFEPFDRAGLRTFDPAGHAAVERLWLLDRAAIETLMDRSADR